MDIGFGTEMSLKRVEPCKCPTALRVHKKKDMLLHIDFQSEPWLDIVFSCGTYIVATVWSLASMKPLVPLQVVQSPEIQLTCLKKKKKKKKSMWCRCIKQWLVEDLWNAIFSVLSSETPCGYVVVTLHSKGLSTEGKLCAL